MKRRRESLFFSLLAIAIVLGKLCGSELAVSRGGSSSQDLSVEATLVALPVDAAGEPTAQDEVGTPLSTGEARAQSRGSSALPPN